MKTSDLVMPKPPYPIDVVYTWAGESFSEDSGSSNNNELKYSLRSIHKFLPWVNHIFILVNYPKKVPSWFGNNYRRYISLFDLRETFPRLEDTPNTNSNAIEFTLHRIPGLHEQYIYFCDDFFIGQPLPYTYFFTQEGEPFISHYVKHPISILKDPNHHPLGFPLPEMLPEWYPHIPISYLKSQVIEFEQAYPEYVNWIRATRSRDGQGHDVCEAMGLRCPCQQIHSTVGTFMYKNKKAVAKEFRTEKGTLYGSMCSESYVNSTNLDTLNQLLLKPTHTFAIQDTERDPKRRKGIYATLENFFQKMYPEQPPWEE